MWRKQSTNGARTGVKKKQEEESERKREWGIIEKCQKLLPCLIQQDCMWMRQGGGRERRKNFYRPHVQLLDIERHHTVQPRPREKKIDNVNDVLTHAQTHAQKLFKERKKKKHVNTFWQIVKKKNNLWEGGGENVTIKNGKENVHTPNNCLN